MEFHQLAKIDLLQTKVIHTKKTFLSKVNDSTSWLLYQSLTLKNLSQLKRKKNFPHPGLEPGSPG